MARSSVSARCVPVDGVAHAGDEPGEEEEGLPVRLLLTGHPAHVAVGAAVALQGETKRRNAGHAAGRDAGSLRSVV